MSMSARDDAAPAVSIVLPASGRMDLLDRSLDALMRQSLDPRSYELIVVDDEPNHHTLHLVAGWRTRTLDRGPQALAVHPVRPAPWGASLLQIRHAVCDALLYKKHPALYRERIEARPCWEHYATVAALLLARLCVLRLHGAARNLSHVAEMVFTSALLPPLVVFRRLAGAVRYRVRFA
ncbi:glycosyltransferase family 2 protein [Massilia sp. DD77]|uniref:glycosyltransferase family 2 protein n=1 Tax=Massilia sp. DD77 TaxID=3109349 RepID=UPI002FFEF0A1